MDRIFFFDAFQFYVTCYFNLIFERDTHYVVASVYLLCNKWFRRCHKHNLSLGVPSVVVVHHYRSDKSLSQPGRK